MLLVEIAGSEQEQPVVAGEFCHLQILVRILHLPLSSDVSLGKILNVNVLHICIGENSSYMQMSL